MRDNVVLGSEFAHTIIVRVKMLYLQVTFELLPSKCTNGVWTIRENKIKCDKPQFKLESKMNTILVNRMKSTL